MTLREAMMDLKAHLDGLGEYERPKTLLSYAVAIGKTSAELFQMAECRPQLAELLKQHRKARQRHEWRLKAALEEARKHDTSLKVVLARFGYAEDASSVVRRMGIERFQPPVLTEDRIKPHLRVGMSVAELARDSGATPQTVLRAIRGNRWPWTRWELQKLLDPRCRGHMGYVLVGIEEVEANVPGGQPPHGH